MVQAKKPGSEVEGVALKAPEAEPGEGEARSDPPVAAKAAYEAAGHASWLHPE